MKDPGSFRDPSGYVFYENDEVFRVVNHSYKKNYDHLISSVLYEKLKSEKLLVGHSEVQKKQKTAKM